MKNWWIIWVLFLVFACQNSEQKVVTLDDLSKPSQKYFSEERVKFKNESKRSDFDSISYFSKKLVDTLGISKKNVYQISTLLFPDRFNPVQSDKWYGVIPSDSFVYKHWKYSDTNIAENTYYNLLDHFGDKQLSLKFGDKLRVSSNAFVLLLQHRSLLLLESKKQINLPKLVELLDTLGFGSTWKFVLFQDKGKKTEWFEQLNLKSKNENSKP